MCPGFESRESHDFIYLFIFFHVFCYYYYSANFENSTLLFLLSFSYFITPYDAQASSAFSALIFLSSFFEAPLSILKGLNCTTWDNRRTLVRFIVFNVRRS